MMRVRKNAQPFCALAICIEVGSPTIASERPRHAGRQRADQRRRAKAAGLLVMGEGEMQRHRERPARHRRHQRQDERDEALHVGAAAAVEPAAILPARSVRRNGSLCHSWPATGTTSVWPDRMTPPRSARADRREQIGLAVAGAAARRGDADGGRDRRQPSRSARGSSAPKWCRRRPGARGSRAPRQVSRQSGPQTCSPLPPAGVPIIVSTSRRVVGSARKTPSIRLVTMLTPGLWTPRVVMH